MVALKLDSFAGMAPRISDRLKNPAQAGFASNAKIVTGSLVGFNALKYDRTLTSTSKRVYPVHKDDGSIFYISSSDPDARILPSPVVGDIFDRYYRTQDGGDPEYLDLSTIEASGTWWKLGIPRPGAAPGCTPSGGTGPTETRAYVVTFVSAYGEEGPPSDPVFATGNDDGTWALTGLPSTNPDANRDLDDYRIYRTITTADGRGAFYFVAEQAIGTTTYDDTVISAEIVFNDTLESEGWDAPPTEMQGLTAHSSGFFAGFKGKDVYLSEIFRPHAWPAAFVVSCDHPVVGIESVEDQLVILTKGKPVVLIGNDPGTLQKIVLDYTEPCIANRSIVADAQAVMYASSHGLIRIVGQVAENITLDLIEPVEWRRQYASADMLCGRYDDYFLAFNTPSGGFAVSWANPGATLTRLDRFRNVEGVDIDPIDGELLVLSGDRIFFWDRLLTATFETTWRSKLLVTPKEINLGAIQIHFRLGQRFNPEDLATENDLWQQYNDLRLAAGPLDVINGYALNGATDAAALADLNSEPPRQPLGGDPIFAINRIDTSSNFTQTRVRLYGDDVIRYDNVIRDDEIHKLPSGYRASRWQVELFTVGEVEAVYLASTGKELLRV